MTHHSSRHRFDDDPKGKTAFGRRRFTVRELSSTSISARDRAAVACHSLQNVRLAFTVTGVTRLVATVWRRARVVMTRGSVRPDVRRDSPEVFVCKVHCLGNLELYSYLFLAFILFFNET